MAPKGSAEDDARGVMERALRPERVRLVVGGTALLASAFSNACGLRPRRLPRAPPHVTCRVLTTWHS